MTRPYRVAVIERAAGSQTRWVHSARSGADRAACAVRRGLLPGAPNAEYVSRGRTWAGISTGGGEIPAQKRHWRRSRPDRRCWQATQPRGPSGRRQQLGARCVVRLDVTSARPQGRRGTCGRREQPVAGLELPQPDRREGAARRAQDPALDGRSWLSVPTRDRCPLPIRATHRACRARGSTSMSVAEEVAEDAAGRAARLAGRELSDPGLQCRRVP